MTEQTVDSAKFQLGKPMSFIRITYRKMSGFAKGNVGEGLLKGAETIERQLPLQISTPA